MSIILKTLTLLLATLVSLPVFAQSSSSLPANMAYDWGSVATEKRVTTSLNKVQKADCTNWVWSQAAYGPYLHLVKYKVRPGASYTLYHLYHTGSSDNLVTAPYANAAAFSFDPFLDKEKNASSGDKGKIFGVWGQSPYKTKTGWTAKRINFRVDPRSTGDTLYILFSSEKPGWAMGCLLKDRPDSDKEVTESTYSPYSGRKGFTWGQVLKEPVYFCGNSSASKNEKPVQRPDRTESPPSSTVDSLTVLKEVPTARGEAPLISYNSTVSARIEPRGDYDTYRFYFPGGKFSCYMQGDLDLVADLVGDSGKLVERQGHQDSRPGFKFSRELSAGYYYLHIRFMHHGGTGAYAVVLGDGKKRYEEKN